MTDIRQPDLFSAARYPHRAGFKEKGGTSQDAAEAIEAKGRAHRLRDAVLGAFELGWTGTADELADRLNESVLAVRPRVSELHKQGWLERSGSRHRNQSGASAHVWQLNPTRATRRAG